MIPRSLDQVFKVLRNYEPQSLPKYAVDWLGFNHKAYRHLLPDALETYVLRNCTYIAARPFTHDRVIVDENFIHKIYTKHFDIQYGDTIVDFGAHIGAFTIFAAKKAKNEKAQNSTLVYSYEPDPTNFAILKMNIKLNDLDREVRAFQNAVAGKAGTLSLYRNETGVASTVNSTAKRISIEAVTLQDIFLKNKLSEIDFLKVDVEGAEWDLFSAARRSDCLTKIKKISMETHSAKDTLRLKRLFKTFGFRVQIAPRGHPTLAYFYAKRD